MKVITISDLSHATASYRLVDEKTKKNPKK